MLLSDTQVINHNSVEVNSHLYKLSGNFCVGIANENNQGTGFLIDTEEYSQYSHSVPRQVLFSNSFLKDLDLIWELREWIPDPTKPLVPPSKRTLFG